MDIPDFVVGVAAQAIAGATDAHGGFIGTVEAARIAVEAAAPYLRAEALRDVGLGNMECPEDSDLLLDLADKLDPQ